MPLEDRVYRFRDKEYEENPLPIIPYGSRGVTVTKDNISTLNREDNVVDDGNDPVPENVLHSEDVLPSHETLKIVYQGIKPWHQSRNFPVGKVNLKTVYNIRV